MSLKPANIHSITGQPWQWCEIPDESGVSTAHGYKHCIGTADEPTGDRWLCEHHAAQALATEAVQLLLF